MMSPKYLLFLIAILLIVGAGAGWFIYKDFVKSKTNVAPITNDEQKILTPEEIKQRIPNLEKEIIIKAQISEAQKQKTIQEIKDTRSKLTADYDDLANWLQLGLLYKAVEDYPSAVEAWVFASLIRPRDWVAFHNLGDLYWMNIKDFPKAEIYFRKAIANNTHPMIFQKLYELYRYSYTEKASLAVDVLKEGIAVNPKEPALIVVLADYYRDTGSKTNALDYYKRALELVPGNTYIVENLNKLK